MDSERVRDRLDLNCTVSKNRKYDDDDARLFKYSFRNPLSRRNPAG